ncbi:MAG: hypothetical protein M3P18_19115 [Actinomycetota bacterium]|nr:hypothetical protein [Actinomycetota bacterium]
MTRRRLSLWLVAVLTMLGLLFPAVVASGSSTTTDGGYLNLHFKDTSAAATLTQYSSEPPGLTNILGVPQNLTPGSGCSVAASGPELATITPTGGLVGAENSGTKFIGLGVKGSGSNGTNCGRVEPNEKLTVALGGNLKLADGTDPTGLLVATAAELDIDAKGSALVRADLSGGLVSSPVYALLSTQAPSGDSGPDATSGDNFAFPINAGMPACPIDSNNNPIAPAAGGVCRVGTFAPFRSVTLSTSPRSSGTPSFALEGGRTGDPISTGSTLRATTVTDSVFKLQQAGTLSCGDKTGDVGGSGGTPIANVERFANADSSTCTPIAYLLQTSTNADRLVSFQKNLAGQTEAQFEITITWPPEPVHNPVPPTQIQYVGGSPHPEQWCNGTTTPPTVPSGEFWCLTDQHTQITSGNMMQVIEMSYGKGDPNYKRT